MTDPCEAYSRDVVQRFPLDPSTHNDVWRYLFDWAIVGDALNCGPGDQVLEFGAGSAFAAELFNRLGYRTVSLDLDRKVLGFARERWDLDARLDRRRAHFVAGDGMRLPFRDAVFDGVVCLNALHHMADYTMVLAELRRVLKPGGRAAFSEPGRFHDQSGDARLARERGALERSVHLDEIARIAREVGFARVLLKPYVYPYLVELAYEEFRRYRWHVSRSPFTQPHQIARFTVDFHPLFVLQAPGARPVTSATARAHGALVAALEIEGVPARVQPCDEVTVRARVRNVGPATWLHGPREFGGDVALGMKMYDAGGRFVSDALLRVPLPRDVAQGETVELAGAFVVPWLDPGTYLLKFDLLSEQVAWFEAHGSPVVTVHCTVEPTTRPVTSATARAGRVLLAALEIEGVPACVQPCDEVTVRARVRNVGPATWLCGPRESGGDVALGMKVYDAKGGVVSDELLRVPLPRDVVPGETVELTGAFAVPWLSPGTYLLKFDMLCERVDWFEAFGSPGATVHCTVAPRDATSRHPRVLQAELTVNGFAPRAHAGDTLVAEVTARNTGDSRWLAATDPAGGYVTVGTKLFDASGRILTDALGRTALPHDVEPGGEVHVRCEVPLPPTLPAGSYVLRFDVVNEHVAWFEQYGSPTVDRPVVIGEDRASQITEPTQNTP